MAVLINLIAGILFGLGLVLSGMADPAKVLNFLDIAGTWDPSLAFVMAGAVSVTALGFALVLRRGTPLLAETFTLPATRPITPSLIGGAALFGLGWGLGGLCPGPAFASVALAAPGTLVFMPAMIAGIAAGAAVMHAFGRDDGL